MKALCNCGHYEYPQFIRSWPFCYQCFKCFGSNKKNLASYSQPRLRHATGSFAGQHATALIEQNINTVWDYPESLRR